MEKKKKISPFLIIIISFVSIILIGTILLLLPFATKEGIKLGFVNALFMATSSVCVTGLVPTATSVADTYTMFGQIVIYVLIEIGGLGFVNISMFVLYLLGLRINQADRFLLREALNLDSTRGILKLLRATFLISFCIQLLGAIGNFFIFRNDFPTDKAIWISIFHAGSAFNNAGLDVIGSSSLMPYKGHLLLNLNTMALIILGGIGFIVIYEIFLYPKTKRLSIHTKIVLKMTLLLLVLGTILLKITEGSAMTWLQAAFQSTTARTAGFSTYDFSKISLPGALIFCFLMYIGASPAGTGGGIKTTTFFTAAKYIGSFARGTRPVTHNREISKDSISKTFVLIVLSIVYLAMIVLFVSVIEQLNTASEDADLIKIMFETLSAFSTVGNSEGITPTLHWVSKILISATMLIGRLGPITIISLLNKRWNKEGTEPVSYLEEKIIIG
ncbi:MAG: potassium transporter TrkG [Bacilli bacterium]|jgi:trk system potassium uptake protein TrkH|nr:potassium transporter TrkG [Bacilli bacterium]HQB80364.1 potassium transporter TrkG [Bacilli bacterium]